MPQITVLKNLIKFVVITEKKFSDELKATLLETKDEPTRNKLERQLDKHQAEFPLYIKKLEEMFLQGMCAGFSICHGIMQEEGQLEWWEAVLRLVANWKNEPLDKKIMLTNKKVSTRSQLFERVLNYIYFTQSSFDIDPLSSFLLNNMHQNTLLNPLESKSQTHYALDYLDCKNHIKTIQKNINIAGSFTIEQLERLLKPNLRENILGIVHSSFTQHAIRIGKKDKFIIYNANYSHITQSNWLNYFPLLRSNTPPIYKEFNHLNEMLNELIKIQGTSLAVVLASFNEDEAFDRSYYDELVSTVPHLLIKNGGLHHIAKFNPIVCNTIITEAKSSVVLESILASELARVIRKNTTFHFVAQFACDAMLQLTLLAEHPSGKNIHTILPPLLIENNEYGSTGLHVLAQCSPKSLLKLLNLAIKEEGIAIRQQLAKALPLQDLEGWTGLHMISRYAPDTLPKLLHLAESKEGIDIQQELAKALSLQSSDGWTGLQAISRYAPDTLPKLLHLAESKEGIDIRQQFTKALSLQASDGWTGLHIISRYAPHTLPTLLHMAESKEGIDIRQQLAKALPLQNCHGWTGLHMISRHAPHTLSTLLDMPESKEGIDIRQQLAKALALKNSNHWTALSFIAYYAPLFIPRLIHLMQQDEMLMEDFHRAIRHSNYLNHSAITEYVIQKNIQTEEEKPQRTEPTIIIPDKPLLKQSSEPVVIVQEKKQTIKPQDRNYSKFFKPIFIGTGAIIGGATAGLGGAIILSTAAYLVPKAQNALSENCKKYRR